MNNMHQNRIPDKMGGINDFLMLVKSKYYDKYIKKDMLNNIDDERIQDLICRTILEVLPPEGISKEVWDAITTLDDKLIILNSITKAEAKVNKMNFIQKILSRLSSDDVEPAMSTLSLICALILTIPFGIAGMFNQEQLVTLNNTLSNCPKDSFFVKAGLTWNYYQQQVLSNLACNIYASMIGLLIAVIYYILKPDDIYMDKWFAVKGKLLLLSMFLVTASSIISLMNLTSDVFQLITVPIEDLCEWNNNPFFVPGITFLIFSIFFTVFLML